MIKNTLFHHHREEGRRGQSLVEFALVLPVLLLIVAGTLEVANILTIQNRAQQAAREGARFGAAGGTDGAVVDVVKQASAGSLDIDPAQMSVWVVRPVIDVSGPNWSWEGSGGTWGSEDEYCSGDMCDNPLKPSQVLDDVKEIEDVFGGTEEAIDGTRFVVVTVYYRADTVLNLPFFRATGQEGDQFPLWAYAVLNQEVEQETVAQRSSGCSAYSLVIERGWLEGKQEGETIGPVTLNDEEAFGGVGREGYKYVGWRYDHDEPNWAIHKALPHFLGSMWFPGTSLTPGWGFIEYDDAYAAFRDAGNDDADAYDDCDACDKAMHRGDWVISNKTTNADARVPLDNDAESHITTQRTLRILVYDYADDYGAPPNPRYAYYGSLDCRWMYRIDAFAIVRVKGFTQGASDTMTFEFVRWDNSCGFDE
jgi:hypothetical protein